MLAPWCELESAEPLIATLGIESMSFWSRQDDSNTVQSNGSLVVANARDIPDLVQFSTRASHFCKVDGLEISSLEPDLAGRFESGLFFANECHLDPRATLARLAMH
jgi:glycine oxidase